MQIKSLITALAAPSLCIAAAIPIVHLGNGDSSVAPNDFRFIASLQTQDGWNFCGGTLLNPTTVVTAGHCAFGYWVQNSVIRVGSHKKSSGPIDRIGIKSIHVHPKYNLTGDLDSDVAIFKLATPVPDSPHVEYATLPPAGSDPADGTVMTVAGWGDQKQGDPNTFSEDLLRVDVPIVDRATCRSDEPYHITDNMLCAGYKTGQSDSCQGDSGGPLVPKGQKELVGIVSFGDGCGKPNKPSGYVRVAMMLDFIKAYL